MRVAENVSTGLWARSISIRRDATRPTSAARCCRFDTLRPWLEKEHLPNGHLIRYRGEPIAEADTAFKATVRRAKIDKKSEHLFSAAQPRPLVPAGRDRHGGVSIFVGNGKIPEEAEVTLVYSPWAPEYLVNCRRAVEAFVHEINTHTKKRDPTRPYATKPDWKED